eukprot:TRINITY_DN26113_c0_g1_i1.p1 TRINITY_DN26113_c0_g1~~TRINITY_DN26113_c0_g1_i1.p1  ORF type:complete len:398 (-),score=55.00 TRINITY_DN26113_c0_g1_i1:44-1141(-)
MVACGSVVSGYYAREDAKPEILGGNAPCGPIPEQILGRNRELESPSVPYASFNYWDLQPFLAKINAYGNCTDPPLGPEFDVNIAIRDNAARFKSLIGNEAEHLTVKTLPNAVGLEWVVRTFQSINRPLFYENILNALVAKKERKDVPWWTSTSPVGALTVAALLQGPLRILANSPGNVAVGDIGSGSGFLVAMLALMTGPDAKVVGVEYGADLAKLSVTALTSKAVFDSQLVGGEEVARAMANKVHIYMGDGVRGTVSALPSCRKGDAPFGCDSEEKHLPTDFFDIINVGFGLFEPFPVALTRTVREGGHMLIPTCTKKSKNNTRFCDEVLTLYRRVANGELQKVTSVTHTMGTPGVNGIFVVAS